MNSLLLIIISTNISRIQYSGWILIAAKKLLMKSPQPVQVCYRLFINFLNKFFFHLKKKFSYSDLWSNILWTFYLTLKIYIIMYIMYFCSTFSELRLPVLVRFDEPILWWTFFFCKKNKFFFLMYTSMVDIVNCKEHTLMNFTL